MAGAVVVVDSDIVAADTAHLVVVFDGDAVCPFFALPLAVLAVSSAVVQGARGVRPPLRPHPSADQLRGAAGRALADLHLEREAWHESLQHRHEGRLFDTLSAVVGGGMKKSADVGT